MLSLPRLHEYLASFEWPTPDEAFLDLTDQAAREAFVAAQARPRTR